jgi:hypothetical protein
MNYEWLGDGGLRLTWSNPPGAYDQLRIVLTDQTGNDILYVQLPTDKEELVIPREWIQQISALIHPVSVGWVVQTRAYTNTDDHNNYARGISDTIGFDWQVPSDDHGDTYDGATPVSTDGTLYPGNIETTGDVDYFRFDADAGDTYVIETSNLGGGCDTVITLFDTDGTTLITEDDDGASEPLASIIEWNSLASGTYYVRVKDYDYDPVGNGSYSISIRRSVWVGPADFGEIEFTVTPDGTGITKIKITFASFSCGGFTTSGSLTRTQAVSPWPISNDQFTALITWTTNSRDREMAIGGTFDSQTHAAGSFEANYEGSICPGIWDASRQ